LKLAVAWYQNQRPGLGQELRQSVEELLLGIQEHPERWPAYQRNVRRAVLKRFPYILYYELAEDIVKVARIVHASRDPLSVKNLLP
jgi:plasmid stabilization system protein ParE